MMANPPPGDTSARPPGEQPKGTKEAASGRPRIWPPPWWLIFLGLMTANYVLVRVFFPEPSSITPPSTFFKKQVEAGNVEAVSSVGDSIQGSFKTAVTYPIRDVATAELDAIGRTRGSGAQLGGHDEREQTLTQILTEMDGFDSREGVIVLAAANRADMLDLALLRPGRFDRRVVVQRPDRAAILKVHTKNVPLAPDVSLERIAAETPGLVGAELRNLVNEAALHGRRASWFSIADRFEVPEKSHD